MEKFIVEIKEVWFNPMQVMADSAKDAVARVGRGEGERIGCGPSYDHTLEVSAWIARPYNE